MIYLQSPDEPVHTASPHEDEDEEDDGVDSSDDEIDMLTKENPGLSLVQSGTRVTVWWPDDAHYYVGTVTHVRKSNTKPFYIEYDDGEFEWIDLRQHKFHLVTKDQEISRRVSDYDHRETKDVAKTVQAESDQPRRRIRSAAKSAKEVAAPDAVVTSEMKDHVSSHGVVVEPQQVAAPDAGVIAEMNLDLEVKIEKEAKPEVVEMADKSQKMEVESESKAEFEGKCNSSSDRTSVADLEKALDSDEEVEVHSESKSENDGEAKAAAQSDDEILVDSDPGSPLEENPEISLVDVGTRIGLWWPEDRRYYPGVIIGRQKKGRRTLHLEYDDDDVKEWINLREHRFRILGDTVRQFAAGTTPDADKMEHEREEKLPDVPIAAKRRRVKRPNSQQTASKLSADAANTDDERVETNADVFKVKKRGKAQQQHNSQRVASKPSADTDDADDERVETSAHVSKATKRQRVELLNSQRAASKASADADNMGNKGGEKLPDVPVAATRRRFKRPNSQQTASKLGADPANTDDERVETNADVFKVKKRGKAQQQHNSRRVASKPSTDTDNTDDEGVGTTPDVNLVSKRWKVEGCNSQRDASKASADTDNADEGRVEASPDISLISVGLRVAVWWPEDQKYYDGTVTKERKGKKPFYLEYDDGEQEWINFLNHRFRLLRDTKRRNKLRVEVESENDCSDMDDAETVEASPDVSAVAVGSRVAVWWPDDRRYYEGTVTKERQGKNPFFLDYDDGEEEWIDFRNHRFRLQTDTKLQRVKRRKKRLEFMSELSNGDTVRKSSEDLGMKVGSRVAVWWPDDRRYYGGTVTRQRNKKNPFFLEYNDGEKEWIDFHEHRYLLLDQSSDNVEESRELSDFGDEGPSKKRRVDSDGSPTPSVFLCGNPDMAQVEVGTRVSVWWVGDEEFFDGTVTRRRNPAKISKKPFYVEYDDGDNEWIDLAEHKFRLLRESSQKHNSESEVEESRRSTKKSRTRTVAKDESELEDESSEGEDNFEISSVISSDSESKGKSRILHDSDALSHIRSEECSLCQSGRMTKPRATECHHLFCESCVQDHFESDPHCPVCNCDFGEALQLSNEIGCPAPFRPVERIDMVSCSVCELYPSASAASRKVPEAPLASRIVDACRSRRKGGREYAGFFWRFHGAKDRILREDESATDGIPVEQVDLQTNEVIGTFRSTRQASEATGASRCAIGRVLDGRGKARADGFFWRFQGSSSIPWLDPEKRCTSAVEKLCLESGDILDTYPRLADAKRAMGLKPTNARLRETCDGKARNSALGFFWRWKGSDAYPSKLVGYSKTVQVRRSKGGPVVREFPSAKMAADWLEVDLSTICRWCRDHSFNKGCYWSYAFTLVVSEEEKAVGKRLRIRHPGQTKWLDGKAIAFNKESGEFTIMFDSGEAKNVDLKATAFEWMNDEGQTRVEKLCRETGQVLHTYESISDAARDSGFSVARISGVLNGEGITCKGFFWRFQGSDALPLKQRAQLVDQLCLTTGQVLATHQSIHRAAKTVGIAFAGISCCCNGYKDSKSAGGFGWRFSTPDEEEEEMRQQARSYAR
jgi:hypothetical protein